MTSLAKLLEAALFASPRPIVTEELAALDPESSPAALAAALDELREHYDVDGHGVELVEQGGGWQILTRAEYTEAIERAQLAARPARLSAAALESLAIIAYRQPIGRAEIEEIRGVGVGGVLKSLHERGLIDVIGRGEGIGRPLLYGTTPQFLEQFALRHLEELPRADELAIALRQATDAGQEYAGVGAVDGPDEVADTSDFTPHAVDEAVIDVELDADHADSADSADSADADSADALESAESAQSSDEIDEHDDDDVELDDHDEHESREEGVAREA